ncbi:MAG TPA: ABC transporter permease [Anaerolineae bacterium]|nr:ABC transporter permease [Anaerolineae bacterium]
MLTYIIRRLLWLPILLMIIIFITFWLGFYGPGSPEQVLLGQRYTPETAELIRAQWGLDDPFWAQYLRYLKNYLTLNFGESLTKYQGQPVARLLARRLPVTIQLNFGAIAIGIPLGLFLGAVAAFYRGSLIDRGIIFFTVLFRAVPTLVAGPVLLFIFAKQLKILPVGGWDGLFSASAILPVSILASGMVAGFARQTRANMLDALNSDYVRTARAKGLTEVTVVGRHVLQNALIPLVTIFGFVLGGVVEGTLITETIFGIPGMGQLAFDAIGARDYPIIIAVTVLGAVIFALANLWADLFYGVIDPRIRNT